MRVVAARVTGHGRLWLEFADGCSGEGEIPMQAGDPLAEVFDQARCNGLTVEWPGGIDYPKKENGGVADVWQMT